MGIEYKLGAPAAELHSMLGGSEMGIFPEQTSVQDGFLVLEYCNLPGHPSPFRHQFIEGTGELVVFYDKSKGAMFGSAPRSERIQIPLGTQTIRFEVEGGDKVDFATGRALDDLTSADFIKHFFLD